MLFRSVDEVYEVNNTEEIKETNEKIEENIVEVVSDVEPFEKPNEDVIEDIVEDVSTYKTISDIDFSSISSYRTGDYHYQTGIYQSYNVRVCLNDYLEINPIDLNEYSISISDLNYQLLIREMDYNMKFIKTTVLKDGDIFIPSEQCKYVGIVFYVVNIVGVCNFNTYKQFFENGGVVSVEVHKENDIETNNIEDVKDDIKEDIKEDEIKFEDIDFKTLKEQLIYMIKNNITDVVDISKFNITWSNFITIRDEVRYNDCLIENLCCGTITYEDTRNSKSVLQTLKMNGTNDDFLDVVENAYRIIKEIKLKVTEDTLDVEKALLCHDYIVKNVTYNKYVENTGIAGYVLKTNIAICSGYSQAMRLLLKGLDVKSYYVSSPKMSHGWTIIELDGEYYHLDCTWDNTRSRTSGEVDRLYFLHSTSSFESTSNGKKAHTGWTCYNDNSIFSVVCDSKKYDDWFVHDVIGDMIYKDGLWYYTIDDISYRSKIDGSEREII